MKKIKVILDCDTGLDDGIAIATLGAIKNFEILGICTVAGNVEVNKTTQNTLDILNNLNKDTKVFKGLNKPLKRDLKVAYDFHGESGIGNLSFDKSSKKEEEIDAISFMKNMIELYPNEVNIVAVGPSTNVAKLLIENKNIDKNIASITFMGGSLCGGNVTDFAEFNVYCDPEASKILINSQTKIRMIGLDATMKGKLYKEDIAFLNELSSKEAKLTKILYDEMLSVRGNMGFEFAVFHDSTALISLVRGDLFKFEKINLDVSLDEKNLGETYKKSGGKEVEVALDFDKNGFKDYMKDIFK